jgi:hypothetical protein
MKALAIVAFLAAGCGRAYEAQPGPGGGNVVRGARYRVDLPKGWELEGDGRNWGASRGECQLLVNASDSFSLRLFGRARLLDQTKLARFLTTQDGVVPGSVRCADTAGEAGGAACTADAVQDGLALTAKVIGHSTKSSLDTLFILWPSTKTAACGQDEIAASFRRLE